ncbi:MAG: AraC family transcriptional regulator [Alcaligenes sp.]|uniref:AraC family transcriptional regulator n=1 Tax=Alcaligenes aquatilis TaxID=323284 RepID=UPI000F660BB4|nr:AraC family transcriptional regulator [Alcaligenes aquatilis]QXR36066.1 AraC family transcriptional regulator [Alcaligenes aquatilis]
MSAENGLDLSVLYRHPIFHSHSAELSHQPLSRAISRHALHWGRGRINTSLYRRDIDQISLMRLGYGAEVEIQADAFGDFCLVQMPLQGTAEFISDGHHKLTAYPGDIAVVSPRHHVRTLWQAGCEQLIVKIPYSLFDGVGHQTLTHEGMTRGCVYKLDPCMGPQWANLIQHLLLLPAQHSNRSASWTQHIESSLALFLLSHPTDKQAVQALVDESMGAAARAGQMRLLQAKNYVLAHLHSNITLNDLAQAAGVSPRFLHLLCRRHHQQSPMSWVRNLRLDAAHQVLQSRPRPNVTEVALAHGFGHLGRFSAYYQQRFKELPHQTGQTRHTSLKQS